MPEPRSSLAGRVRPGRFGAGTGSPGLTLTERPLGTLIQVCGFGQDFEQAASPLMRRLGFTGPGTFTIAQETDGAVAFRIAPCRILLRLADRTIWEEVARLTDPAQLPSLDLSHARSVIGIAGPDSAALLMRLVPIDVDPAVFRTGYFAQSGLHSVPVLLHRRVDAEGGLAFELHLPRSFAASIWELVAETAAPFGYRVDASG